MSPVTAFKRLLSVSFSLFVVLTGTAAAQPAGYVAVSGFGDIRQFGSTAGNFYGGTNDVSFDVTGAGGSLRIGTFLHPRWSLELGVDAATRETVEIENPLVILIFPPIPRPELKASTSFINVSTMVGFHPPAMGRVHLGYRAGFSFLRGTYKSEYPGYPYYPFPILADIRGDITAIFSPTVVLPRTTLRQRHNTGALTLGFDAAIDVTSRLALVPEIRALAFSQPANGPGVFLIRPGVGVRWKF